MRQRMMVVVAILGLALAACSSGGSSTADGPPPPTDPKTHWNVKASATLDAVAKQIGQKIPGACPDWGLYGEADFLVNSRRVYKFASPAAVGRCSVLTDQVDLAAFATHAEALDWANTHARILCKVAARAKVGLTGINWVIGPKWTAQPDTEGVTRKLADVVGARYLFTACPGPKNFKSWDDVAVAHANAIAAKLDGAGLGCNDFLLQDRDLLIGNKHYVDTGLPSAYGACTIQGQPGAGIETFDNSKIDPATFATTELPYACGLLRHAAIMVVPKGLVIVPSASAVAVATALGVAPPTAAQTCPS